MRRSGEVRPGNAGYNATTWGPWSGEFPRATGNFTGSTDDIIQWAACKWGFDENTLRAQVAKESYWTQTNLGDWTTNPNNCPPGHPIGADGRAGQCPESVGLMQVRTPYFRDSIEGSLKSSAYNLDIALSVWRRCYEGGEAWLNTSNGAANTVPVTPGGASAGGSPAAGTPHRPPTTSRRSRTTSTATSGPTPASSTGGHNNRPDPSVGSRETRPPTLQRPPTLGWERAGPARGWLTPHR